MNEQEKYKMTDEEFDNYVHENSWDALRFHADRLTPEQFDYCVRKFPITALEKYAYKLTNKQKKYCEEIIK